MQRTFIALKSPIGTFLELLDIVFKGEKRMVWAFRSTKNRIDSMDWSINQLRF